MSHELIRLMDRIVEKPLLADQRTIENIYSFLKERNSGSDMIIGEQSFLREEREQLQIGENGTAILNIDGPLTYNLSFFQALCGAGMASYESILANAQFAINSGVKTLVLAFDSPGGEARGTFETARQLRKMADEADIKLISFIEGTAASAAYALAATSHEIIAMNDNAIEIGSIGVRIALKNNVPKEMAEGTEIKFITAGEDKVPLNEDGKFKASFLEGLKESADTLFEDFVTHVAEARGMSSEAVISTKARTFNPTQALELGLIDKVMSREEFFTFLADLGDEGRGNTSLSSPPLTLESNEETIEMNEAEKAMLAQLQEDVTNLSGQLADKDTAFAALTSDNKALLEREATREAVALASKVEGFSFIEDKVGFAAVLGGLGDAEQSVLMSVLDNATTALEESEAKVKTLEEEKEGSMFSQLSENGETLDLGSEDKVKEAVKAKLQQVK